MEYWLFNNVRVDLYWQKKKNMSISLKKHFILSKYGSETFIESHLCFKTKYMYITFSKFIQSDV